MRNFNRFPLVLLLMGLGSCVNTCNCCEENDAPDPLTVAIHNPIYPDYNDPVAPDILNPVTFTLFLKNDAEIEKVELSITKQTLDVATLLWRTSVSIPGNSWIKPVNFPLTYQHSDGFNKNELITYIFKITPEGDAAGTYEHKVTFATKPYPFSMTVDPKNSEPAPVYVTKDKEYACDVVFIPDQDMVSIERRTSVNWRYYFFNSVRDNILNGIFGDPSTMVYSGGFNFYINHLKGEIDAVNTIFAAPQNFDNLNFAEGKSYVHNKEQFEFANNSTLIKSYTNRVYNRGTFMHESGHCLFFLADEYEYGAHWFDATTPNNWLKHADALADAPSFSLTEEHIVPLKEEFVIDSCYILCPYEGCQMGMTGLSIIHYCRPCQEAVKRWMAIYCS